MKSSIIIAASLISQIQSFTPPSPTFLQTPTLYTPTSIYTNTRLYATTPEPLATEGDWSAYIDTETTGYIYYFNNVSGESMWDPPTSTFPVVDTSDNSNKPNDDVLDNKEDRKSAREKRREQRRKEREEAAEASSAVDTEESSGGGFLGGLFGGNKEKKTSTTTEQLNELQEIANNNEFLSELDSVIAEAEEAIAIADKMDEAPAANKGGFFSNLGFVSGKEAAEEAETLIADVEERTSNIGGFFSFGAQSAPKKKEVEPEPEPEPVEEENLFVEGLKNLFTKTFTNFIQPETKVDTTTPEKKVVAVDKEEKEQKAKVAEGDFLDVIWGAETSARPTLNIAEMMKAFQVESTTTDEEKTTKAVEEVAEEFKTLVLDGALQVKAHPEKVSWGGEDAGFFTGRTFGIFDGVSGAEKEKGKKLYSRSLAESMKKSSGKAGLGINELTSSMTEAKELADGSATGASTAVVASIGEDNVLRALNIGDSVCLVLRDGAVAARTREIIHYFDCPYQLGDDSPDRPRDGTKLQAEIFKGDVIVAGSDGVFDNLSDADVCNIVSSFGPKTKSTAIAKKLVEQSRKVSLDPEAVTPYSTVARGKSGYNAYRDGKGGKVDDVSCIVVKAS